MIARLKKTAYLAAMLSLFVGIADAEQLYVRSSGKSLDAAFSAELRANDALDKTEYSWWNISCVELQDFTCELKVLRVVNDLSSVRNGRCAIYESTYRGLKASSFDRKTGVLKFAWMNEADVQFDATLRFTTNASDLAAGGGMFPLRSFETSGYTPNHKIKITWVVPQKQSSWTPACKFLTPGTEN